MRHKEERVAERKGERKNTERKEKLRVNRGAKRLKLEGGETKRK